MTDQAEIMAAVEAVVSACHPRTIFLFGSNARGDARPDSDIDLLVVVDDESQRSSAARASTVAVSSLPVEVDVIVTTQAILEANQYRPGTIIRPVLRYGKIVYSRVA